MLKGLRKLVQSEPAVIQRWMKLRSLQIASRAGRRIARPRIWLKERGRVRQLESTFDTIRRQLERLERANYPASKVFMNIALFILIAERDISAVKLDALTHPDQWKRNIALRTVLLTIYEWDLDKVAGKRLRRAMDLVDIPDPLKEEVTSSLRDLRKTQNRARKVMHDVRNAAIAHRDPDVLMQYRAIRDLDSLFVMELAAEFYESADRFIAILPRLIASGGSVPSLVKQLGKIID